MLTVPPAAARRFLRAALALDAALPGVGAALDRLGYVQLDPINVCGRMHDLVLRNRVGGYREGDLLRHLHGPEGAPLPPERRVAFEQVLPGPGLGAGVLAALPLGAWPLLQGAMEARRARRGGFGGRLAPAEARLAERVLAELGDRGPLTSDDVAHDGRSVTAWGTRGRMVKTVLEKLFLHGRVLVAARRGFRRVYDLPERVLPAAVLSAPRPSADDARRGWLLLRLRQRRLAILGRAERALLGDLVTPVEVEGCPRCACLVEDAPRLAAAAEGADGDPAARLLAPLDPLVYDRRLTATLWAFDYRWEVYTPPARRVRGYYALPVLAGLRLVGHVEPRADRARGRLEVVSRRVARGVATRPAVRELARFLGLRPALRW